jgi:hypothetical protein
LGAEVTSLACLLLAGIWSPDSAPEPRAEVCNAILAATRNDLAQRWLLVVAADESGFRPEVLDCRKRGDRGRARGAWQVHGRRPASRRALCLPMTAAPIALARIRESEWNCRHQPVELRHANFASSRCTSAAGRRISASRFARVLASIEEES